MNSTESKAYKWLLTTKGYQPDEIIFQKKGSPDFICADKQGYEVKRVYSLNQIIFHRTQYELLSYSKNTTVLVYDINQKCNTPLLAIPFKNIIKNNTINGIKFYVSPNGHKPLTKKIIQQVLNGGY